ncbi:hypothetical protein MRX96_059331 [Rhipicephalus microplus]
MEIATVEASSRTISTIYEEPNSSVASVDDEDDADVPSSVEGISFSENSLDPPDSSSASASASAMISAMASRDSASRPTRDVEHGMSNGEKLVPDKGTDSVAVTTAPSSSSMHDEGDEPPSAWAMWYLRKDLEWRRRAQREREAQKVALCEARAMAERKAKQRSQAERAFAAWCAMKSELEAARRAEERRRRSKADEDRKRTETRMCALSERKCREWLARKQVEQEASLARKQRITTSGRTQKEAANRNAFNAWLAGKSTMNSTEKFHVKCIDGQLFAVWQ